MFTKNRTISLYEDKINSLEKENKKLQAANSFLRKGIAEAEQGKHDYENLLEELKQIKKKYGVQLQKIEELNTEYQIQLNKIVSDKRGR